MMTDAPISPELALVDDDIPRTSAGAPERRPDPTATVPAVRTLFPERARGRRSVVVRRSTIAAVLILLAAAVLMIGNTIRLSIFARRREIEVMKLVGATNWFVRGPFMVEGFLCGLMGSVAAILLLVISKLVVVPKLDFIKVRGVHALEFELVALLILVAGLMLGAAGSGLTVRRFLRV